MGKLRRARGFTLAELLVVCVLIAILVATAMPNFAGVRDRARNASVKANMRIVQIATESFATDNGGTYPSAMGTPLESYFPGGKSDGSTVGNPTVNPFTNAAVWTDFVAITVSSVQDEQAKAPSSSAIAGSRPGQIGYTGFGASETGTTTIMYAIEGADSNGIGLAGNSQGSTLVLSNR